jgi:hypothetical protein
MLPVTKKQMTTQTLGELIGASCSAAAVGAAAAVIIVKKNLAINQFLQEAYKH